jgi:hypothetical protein
VLDSEEDELDPALEALDSEDADGVWVSVSVVFAVSIGVVVAGVVASAVLAASAGVVRSDLVVWVGSVSVVCVVVDDDAAAGACEAALRAFVEPVELVACFFAGRPPARADLSFAPMPFIAAFAVLPGKACAASSVKAPVSVAEPASSQRLQCAKRRRAASRERLDGRVLVDGGTLMETILAALAFDSLKSWLESSYPQLPRMHRPADENPLLSAECFGGSVCGTSMLSGYGAFVIPIPPMYGRER